MATKVIETTRPVCGAKTTTTGQPCKLLAVPDSPIKRCKWHGGAQPVGLAHPNTTHGRYSKHLGWTLAERVEHHLKDPELMSITVRVAELTALRNVWMLRLEAAGHRCEHCGIADLDLDTMKELVAVIGEEVKAIEKAGRLEVQRGMVHVRFLDILVSAILEAVALEYGDREKAAELFARVISGLRLPSGHEVAVTDDEGGDS